MIVTQSVYKLINELCSSLNSDDETEKARRLSSKQLKSLRCRMHEILLKTSYPIPLDPHELYFHELELTIKGESALKCSAMKECCRLVERDEYFQTEIGQSVMTFLLKLRNSSKGVKSDQVCGTKHFEYMNIFKFVYVLE